MKLIKAIYFLENISNDYLELVLIILLCTGNTMLSKHNQGLGKYLYYSVMY